MYCIKVEEAHKIRNLVDRTTSFGLDDTSHTAVTWRSDSHRQFNSVERRGLCKAESG